MQLGMMNHPARNVLDEVDWLAAHGFEFLDLTIEGPGAGPDRIDAPALRAMLTSANLGVVGHTAWYLPFASPVERVRQAAIDEVAAQLPIFAAVGATLVNVHVAPGAPMFGLHGLLERNAASFAELAERAAPLGIRIMVEHTPDPHSGPEQVRSILDADPRLGFHLDVGHANIGGDHLASFLQRCGGRLCHVHCSDNRGRTDDHMPIGSGRINWEQAIRQIKAHGYDGTITLEVFSDDREYLLHSARTVRRLWNVL